MRKILVLSLKLIVIVFAVEFAIMLAMPEHCELPHSLMALIDSGALIVFGLPLAWAFAVRGEIAKQKRVSFFEKEIGDTIDRIWSVSLEKIPEKNIYEKILELIVSNKAITLLAKAGIFILREGEYRLEAHVGFGGAIIKSCSKLVPGKCLCGRVIETGEAV